MLPSAGRTNWPAVVMSVKNVLTVPGLKLIGLNEYQMMYVPGPPPAPLFR